MQSYLFLMQATLSCLPTQERVLREVAIVVGRAVEPEEPLMMAAGEKRQKCVSLSATEPSGENLCFSSSLSEEPLMTAAGEKCRIQMLLPAIKPSGKKIMLQVRSVKRAIDDGCR